VRFPLIQVQVQQAHRPGWSAAACSDVNDPAFVFFLIFLSFSARKRHPLFMQHMQTHARIMTRPPIISPIYPINSITVIVLVTYSQLLYGKVFSFPRVYFSSKVFTYTVPASYSNYDPSSVRRCFRSHTVPWVQVYVVFSQHHDNLCFSFVICLSHGRLHYRRDYPHHTIMTPPAPVTNSVCPARPNVGNLQSGAVDVAVQCPAQFIKGVSTSPLFLLL